MRIHGLLPFVLHGNKLSLMLGGGGERGKLW